MGGGLKSTCGFLNNMQQLGSSRQFCTFFQELISSWCVAGRRKRRPYFPIPAESPASTLGLALVNTAVSTFPFKNFFQKNSPPPSPTQSLSHLLYTSTNPHPHIQTQSRETGQHLLSYPFFILHVKMSWSPVSTLRNSTGNSMRLRPPVFDMLHVTADKYVF